jgi:hypothetical protein
MIVGGPKLSKSRGSSSNVLEKGGKKPKLFNANTMHAWGDDEMDKEASDMKAMLAALTMGSNPLTSDDIEQDEALGNLSSRMKKVLTARSTGKIEDMGDFGKEMFDLWQSMDDNEPNDVGGGAMDDEAASNAYVIEQANKIRLQATMSSSDMVDSPAPDSPGGLQVPAGGRMRAASSPAYSTDALVELHKGCALMKYGLRGQPKFMIFQLSKDNKILEWFSDKKDREQTRIPIEEMIRIEKNQLHDARSDAELKVNSFSIVYNEENENRLRLTAKNATEAYLWTEGLQKLIDKKDKNEPLGNIKHLILDKQPGLDLHRRQSLANLMEKRTGAMGANMRAKNVKKIRRELKAIRKNHEKCTKDTKSKKFEETFKSPEVIGVDGGVIKTLDQHNKELEKSNIIAVLENIKERLGSLDNQTEQLEGDMAQEMFDGCLQEIKIDAWNCSVDLVALQSKIKVLMANPVIL